MLVTLDCSAFLLAQLEMGQQAEQKQEVCQSCSLPSTIEAMLLIHGQLNASYCNRYVCKRLEAANKHH